MRNNYIDELKNIRYLQVNTVFFFLMITFCIA